MILINHKNTHSLTSAFCGFKFKLTFPNPLRSDTVSSCKVSSVFITAIVLLNKSANKIAIGKLVGKRDHLQHNCLYRFDQKKLRHVFNVKI